MIPLNDSPSPAQDEPVIVPAVEPQRPGALSLYSLTNDLVSLLALREEMAEAKEDTAEVEGTIQAYVREYLPQKVDAVVAVLRTFESQRTLASEEIARLEGRKKQFTSAIDRLKEYCAAVLERLPKPKRGSRKLDGATATMVLKTNGGLEALDIYDESLVPDEYCTFEVTLSADVWSSMKALIEKDILPVLKATRHPDKDAIRKAMAQKCWFCEGAGELPRNNAEAEKCSACGGDGRQHVPGAQLLGRRSHVEIK